jgi:single-strand DNA-binding protein
VLEQVHATLALDVEQVVVPLGRRVLIMADLWLADQDCPTSSASAQELVNRLDTATGPHLVIIAGNLTADPELKYTPKGTAIARLRLAVNRSYKTDTGESREEVTYVDVDAWGQQGETISQFLRKGRPILVEGRLKMDTWDDKATGQKRSKLGVVLESFTFIDSRGQEGGGGAGAPTAPPPRNRPSSAPPSAASAVGGSESDGPPPVEEDDVPF